MTPLTHTALVNDLMIKLNNTTMFLLFLVCGYCLCSIYTSPNERHRVMPMKSLCAFFFFFSQIVWCEQGC